MKQKISSRERLLAALTRQAADHVPFSPYIGQGPWWPKPFFWHDQIERAQCMLAQDEREIDQAVKDAVEMLGVHNGLVLSAIFDPEVPTQSMMLMINA